MTGAQSTVIYMWKIHRQKMITTAHLLILKRANTSEVTFHAKIWFHKHDTPWLTHACVRRHFALTSESWGQYQSAWRCCQCEVNSSDKTRENCKHTTMMTLSWPIRIHFRWPWLYISREWQVAVVIRAVFASSCGIRQSKLPTQHVRPESGRLFPLV